MKVRTAMFVAALLATSSIAPEASAQGGRWWLGLGMSNPVGDAGDAFNSGLNGTAGIAWQTSPNWSFQVEGLMGSAGGKGSNGDLSTLGLMGNVGFDVSSTQDLKPFVYGGLGFMSWKVGGGSSNSDFAWQVGGGLAWRQSANLNIWADLRYLSIAADPSMNFLPLTLGISMPFGTP